MTAPVSYRAAIEAAGKLKAAADRERDDLAATGGPEAVAAAAHRPGGPAVSEITAAYIGLQGRPRRSRAA